MKKFNACIVLLILALAGTSQTPYGIVYNTLNTKCQNASCHSATSNGDGPKFDGSDNAVYAAIFNQPSSLWPASIANYEELVNPQMPYQSFLLRKIAGASFDSDLALDTNGDEGILMLDTGGNPLSNVEIEWVRQWIRYGALQTYGANDPQPDYNTIVSYYTDTPAIRFLPKPPAPEAGVGYRLRCGPVFMPVTGAVEQEIMEQQVVHFPYVPEVYELDGYMNEQSHHFLLFNYIDSANARTPATGLSPTGSVDVDDIAQVTPPTADFTEPFAGGKNLTGMWQANQKFPTPTGTAFMWGQTTYLDMDYHTKNYNATSVLPCDFYFNVFYRPRNTNTIPMISQLVNNADLGTIQSSCSGGLLGAISGSLPYNQSFTQNYADPADDTASGIRYLWMVAGHTHSLGTAFYILAKDTDGQIDTIYNGQYDYLNNVDLGYWQWQHPPLEYWPNQLPIYYGGANSAGLIANTTWFDTVSTRCIYFGFTTLEEMQLFYYMYTTRVPASDSTTGIASVLSDNFSFSIMPNPLNNTGKLIYTLNKAAKIEASIMDVTGKQIALLSQENEAAGMHEILIADGRKLSVGMYFARLAVNGIPHTQKFVVTE